jgi:hypothetical protein
MTDNLQSQGDEPEQDNVLGKQDVPEPEDISLDEQAASQPARDMDSKTDDFETNATLDSESPEQR